MKKIILRLFLVLFFLGLCLVHISEFEVTDTTEQLTVEQFRATVYLNDGEGYFYDAGKFFGGHGLGSGGGF